MKFFYKVDGENFETPYYFKDCDFHCALSHTMEYAQRLGRANESLDYASPSKFGWEFVYVEKIYFEWEE